MGMTVTEKILAKKSGKDKVEPGEILMCRVDYGCIDEQFRIFQAAFDRIADKVWDAERALAIADHYLPPSSVDQAETVKLMKEFAHTKGMRLFTQDGIKHPIFREQGYALPGTLLTGTDSHTNTAGAFGSLAIAVGPTDMAAIFKTGEIWLKVPTNIKIEFDGDFPPMVSAKDAALMLQAEHGLDGARYKAIEYAGSTVHRMSLDERMTLCNMSTEMGAKNGIVAPDELTIAYAQEIGRPFEVYQSDPDAVFESVFKYDVSKLQPLVAPPFSSVNAVPVSEAEGVRVNQALIGTCTNGYLEHLEMAAEILRGKKIKPGVLLLVIPASRQIYHAALEKGLLKVFSEAGAVICNPNCGPCAGMHQGILGSEEVMISSQNRNFTGRNGPPDSKVYLASPTTVAASALEGKIANPQKYAR
jgi:homoaconitate hydratase family protein